jgi:hypothetical protein
MTKNLNSEYFSKDHNLESLTVAMRKGIIARCEKIDELPRKEALHILKNNMKIAFLLEELIELTQDSAEALNGTSEQNVSYSEVVRRTIPQS